MRAFNRYEIVQAITDVLGIKGTVNVELSEQILPGVNVLDLFDSPYLRYGIPAAEAITQPAVAAEFAYVLARPGAGVALQVEKLVIINQGAALLDFSIQILTGTAVTTVGGSTVQIADLGGRIAGTRLSSQIQIGSNASGTLGNAITFLNVPANSHLVFDFPKPGVILYGDDEGGRPGLAAVGSAANTALTAAFYAREWPLPA